MPCFNCSCFTEGRRRNGERLDGGRGYCKLYDQEYWRGHECGSFSPVWYSPKTNRSVLKEPGDYGFLGLFKRKTEKRRNACGENDESNGYLQDDAFENESGSTAFARETSGKQRKHLETVRKHIAADLSVLSKYGIRIKWNLVEVYDAFHLNFELMNTRGLALKMMQDDELTLKANVYDAKGKLLYIEEKWIENQQLKSDYFADCFYLFSESMDRAHSIRIYAIDPTVETDEDAEEDCAADAAKKDMDSVVVTRAKEALTDSLDLIETTVYPQTFFSRFDYAIVQAEGFKEITKTERHLAYARGVVSYLRKNKGEKTKAFIDRCYSRGKLYSIKDELLSGKYDVPEEAKEYLLKLLHEIETKDDKLPENGEYIYCSLLFGATGKTYYYKTNDETLKCGDEVIVPVGKEGRKEVAK
ncbi:MAG: hypothetical protein J6S59_00755, partial [Clostridia bacterium]|nr:hypothetical protein [Clostridia bacterium]